MQITAKPSVSREKIEFDPANIKQVYYGQLNCCRCGCGGEYYEPGVTPKADQFIEKALKELQYRSDYGDVKYDRFTYKDPGSNELYFEFETHSRYNGSAMEDESMGYAFYIKDVPTK